jgi:hypothetical protein
MGTLRREMTENGDRRTRSRVLAPGHRDVRRREARRRGLLARALRAIADAFVEPPAPEEGLLVVETATATSEVLQASDFGQEGERAFDQARAAAIREIDALARRERAKLERSFVAVSHPWPFVPGGPPVAGRLGGAES